MNGLGLRSSLLTMAVAAVLTGCASGTAALPPGMTSTAHASPPGQLGGLPMPFIENGGEADARVAYYAPTFAGTLFVTRQGTLVYSLPGWSLTETLAGGRSTPAGAEPGVTAVSHFRGHDPARWRRALRTHARVGLGEVWPGVTVSLRAYGLSVEKIFTVAPGASADRIRIRVGGSETLSIDASGALVVATLLGPITFTAPVAYQEREGVRHPVAVAYRVAGRDYGFSVGRHDPALPLVIDPLLQSTYLGGTNFNVPAAMAIDPATGAVYVAGSTGSADFPGTAGGAQPTLPDVGASASGFVARLSADLKTITQATFLGGSEIDSISSIAIHPATGDIYVGGTTRSTDLPGTAGSAQPALAGISDAFVARLSGDLTALRRATYLGGTSVETEGATRIAIHPSTGDVYVTGATFSGDFPGAPAGPAHPAGRQKVYVARLSSGLTAVLGGAYLNGNLGDESGDIAIHPATGEVYVAGTARSSDFPGTAGGVQTFGGNGDAFVARLDSSLTTLLQATYLGGTQQDKALAVAIHPATGEVYVAGWTTSENLPGTTEGAQRLYAGHIDGFVARLDASLASLFRASYLGGREADMATSLAIHPTTGDVYVGGHTGSQDFPRTGGGVQPSSANLVGQTPFVARLARSLGALTQATYLGTGGIDSADALAIHPATGDVYVAGPTGTADFPGTAGGAQPTKPGPFGSFDGFVTRLTFSLAATDPSPGPDLTIVKSHARLFLGATYTLTVTNVGSAPSAGMVTVVDTLPSGFTATALSGPGWTCTLNTVTCTRGDALANGSSYPAITLTVTVADTAAATLQNAATVSGGGDVNPANDTATDVTQVFVFTDVPPTSPFLIWIDTLARNGITGGCTPTTYCPDAGITREQIAVFLVRAIHGATFEPPAATGTVFLDVSTSSIYARWIEQLARDGVTGGCAVAPTLYCPSAMTTRAQMAVLLLRARHGPAFEPPDATGTVFADVPATHPLARWIEELRRQGITTGCSPTTFCPDDVVTRAEIAVFLVRTFNLPM